MAEDSAEDTELIMGVLNEHNLANRVVLVRDGAEALDYLCRRLRFKGRVGMNPILLLLDLKMPKVNGLEVLRKMKESPELAEIPVVDAFFLVSTDTESVRGASTRFSTGLKRRSTCDRPMRGTASHSGECIEPLRSDGGLWQHRRSKCGNSITGSSRMTRLGFD
jgi:CheY-like chemotaxis protein